MEVIARDAETDRLIEALAIEAQRGLHKALIASFAAGREAGRADARGAVEENERLRMLINATAQSLDHDGQVEWASKLRAATYVTGGQ